MKKIVCEMCESTEFVKEDGLFVCQGCGCKYSSEDAKKMMKEVDEAPAGSTSAPASEDVDEEENVPMHTSDSPNKLSVTLVKVGHKDFRLPFMQPYFAEGPHPVSKTIGAEILVKNLAGKTVKYVDVYLLPLNAMGEQMYCELSGRSMFIMNVEGPLGIGKEQTGIIETMWKNPAITAAKLDHAVVTYMDHTQEYYDCKELYGIDMAASDTQSVPGMATLFIKRSALPNNQKQPEMLKKLGNLECIFKTGEKLDLAPGEIKKLCVKHGMNRIEFNFWGIKLVLSKDNKATPEFYVDGDMYIELVNDQTLGGFKTTFIKF
ncbi:MAG: TFIIB-type zinc finger domain-containing protein [Clostridia bacterium]|nr:TFIIB-type zinc finger domain-containing protein [Clostridia bacterium]